MHVPLGLFSLLLSNISVHIGDIDVNSLLNVNDFFPMGVTGPHCFRKANTAASNHLLNLCSDSNLFHKKNPDSLWCPPKSDPAALLEHCTPALPCTPLEPPALLTVTSTAQGQIPAQDAALAFLPPGSLLNTSPFCRNIFFISPVNAKMHF